MSKFRWWKRRLTLLSMPFFLLCLTAMITIFSTAYMRVIILLVCCISFFTCLWYSIIEPFYSPKFGTTWERKKKHLSTHTYPHHQPSCISLFHLLRSVASSLFNLCAWQSFFSNEIMSSVPILSFSSLLGTVFYLNVTHPSGVSG